MTYVKGDLNLTLDYASMANSLEVRAPFLDHELVEQALSLDENKHITAKYGRKHFLKVILDSDKIPSTVWNREKIGFSLTTSYRESVDDLKDEALRVLSQEGYLNLHCNSHKSGRDKQYLRSAAFGFYCWKQIWIDSGIVKI
jgi:asparagine synthase (glutamine-hydrolysing)